MPEGTIMTPADTIQELPLLLQILKERPAGELYMLSSKQIVLDGIKQCEQPVIRDVFIKPEIGQVIININNYLTTFTCNDKRLLFSCSCENEYRRDRCSHIITAWACLKRLVTPGSLTAVRFSQDNLNQVARLIGPSPPALPSFTLKSLKKQTTALKSAALSEQASEPAAGYRLIISADLYGKLTGRLCRGNERLSIWGSQKLSPDIRAFLVRYPRFDDSTVYLDDLLKRVRGVKIVFRDDRGSEQSVTYRPDLPLTASIRLESQQGTVRVSAGMDNGKPLPGQSITGEHLLLDIACSTLHPILNSDIWKVGDHLEEVSKWDLKFHDLDPDDYNHNYDYYDEEEDDDDYDDFMEPDDDSSSGWMGKGLEISASEFNALSVVVSHSDKSFTEQGIFFFHDGVLLQPTIMQPTYRILVDNFQSDSPVRLTPQKTCKSLNLPFSDQAFGFLGNRYHLATGGMLRRKKRFAILVETAFNLAVQKESNEHDALIRNAMKSSEFTKHELRQKAISFLKELAGLYRRRGILIHADSDGWFCLPEDLPAQAGILQIMSSIYGTDHFEYGRQPGTILIPRSQFLQSLTKLLEQLKALNIPLSFGETTLETTSLQFSLDATSSSLDWFELKPEIRINGDLLTDQEIQELMGSNGMISKDGRFLLLDELSSQIMEMFSGAIALRKGKKDKGEPVQVPRLQILDWLQLRKHGVEVKLSRQDAEALESLLNFDQMPKPSLPKKLIADLRHYQLDAWHWLSFLYRHRFGACLADDMGLGKTLQGISLMAGILSGNIPSAAPPGSPHLVVAPPSLLFNWEAEISRFLPDARVLLYAGTGRSANQFTSHDIIITSYGIVQREHEKLEKRRFDVIIFDETQVVKNLQAATTNAVRKLKGSFVLALTGTPVENHLGEYYAIMDLCLPGLLGSYDEFNKAVSKQGTTAIQRLVNRTKPFLLRRTKQMIASELPPKIETDIHLELSPKQKALYQRTVEEVKGQVQDAYQNHATAQARIIALTAILRLRQICLSPVLAAASASDSSPKLEFLAEQLLELKDEGHSVLVFSQFTGYLDIIEKGLKQQGLAWLRLDGSTPVPKRKKLVQTFQNSTDPLVFLISLKAGGKGLNLTRATYVYHMDPWWNPAVENQASDRAHRIGQTEQVTITRLIMRHTIEEKMMELKARKLELYKALLEDGTSSGGSSLTREDFEFLLG